MIRTELDAAGIGDLRLRAAYRRCLAIAAEHCQPTADQRGPEDFKRHLVAELTARALRRAAERAGA